MPIIKYEEWNPKPDTRRDINRAYRILNEYSDQGFDLTVRQLFYQFVSRDYIPNTERAYKNLVRMTNRARLAGMLDWDFIVDRTRNIRSLAHFEDPAEIIGAAAKQFRIDKWLDQRCYIEVWIEKDALTGVIEPICNKLDIAYFSCRGYTSQSEMWRASQRIEERIFSEKGSLIIHLGDHDPSGIDMTRDIESRLALFNDTGERIAVNRIALTRDQIEEYNPPPNPTKVTDPRAKWYLMEHGDKCWELDALDPFVIQNLIETEVLAHRDEDKWKAAIEIEKEGLKELSDIVENLNEEA